MSVTAIDVIAISQSDFDRYGCPHCGNKNGYTLFSVPEAVVWICKRQECGETACILADSVERSPICFDGRLYPSVQKHPLGEILDPLVPDVPGERRT